MRILASLAAIFGFTGVILTLFCVISILLCVGLFMLDKQPPEISDEKTEQLFKKAYGRYKLMWMLDHNYTFDDIINTLHEELQDEDGPDDVQTAFAQIEQQGGLIHNHKNNSIWACEDEFRECEWNDEFYMEDLLSADDYEYWKVIQLDEHADNVI